MERRSSSVSLESSGSCPTSAASVWAVWSEAFGAAGEPEALQRLTSVQSQNFKSKELGVIGPDKCGHVNPLNKIIEYKPNLFQ